MRKEFKAIVALILAVWIFVMGIEIGDYRATKEIISTTKAPAPVVNPQTTKQQETTKAQEQTTAAPVVNDTTKAPVADETTKAPVADSNDPSTLSKEQIVQKVNEAVNKVKSEQNMTCRKQEAITITLTALSVERARDTVNGIIQGIAGEPSDETITVVDGIATYPDGTQKSVKEAIPPSNDAAKDFSLPVDGVASATAAKQGDNTVYTVILVEESTTATNPIPTYNSSAIGYLNLLAVDLPAIVTITDSNMHYPGSTVEVTVNSAGQVVRLVNKMPMTGDGTAKITLLGEGRAEFEGGLDESWDFTY